MLGRPNLLASWPDCLLIKSVMGGREERGDAHSQVRQKIRLNIFVEGLSEINVLP